MGVDPNRFWSLTLSEFLLAMEGFQDGQDWMRFQLAWVVSNLLAPHIPKGNPVPSPRQLLGWDEVTPETPADVTAQAAAFDALLGGLDPEVARRAELAAKFEVMKQQMAARGQPLREGGEDPACP